MARSSSTIGNVSLGPPKAATSGDSDSAAQGERPMPGPVEFTPEQEQQMRQGSERRSLMDQQSGE